tara:strand:- start:890 stop:2242 length:1353 start_codon:yes stop_codon:yes gene_type:complete
MADYADAWTLIFDSFAKDKHGFYAVPALALISAYRAVCTEARRGAAGLVTPYDATIFFKANGRTRVPVRFEGGVHFAQFMCYPGLSIIRDRPTGQMFAVYHDGFNETERRTHKGKSIYSANVRRVYPLARLAQLLSEHESHEGLRLGSLQPFLDRNRLGLRNVPTIRNATVFSEASVFAVTAKNQMRGFSWTGEPGPLTVHTEDSISQRVIPHGVHHFTNPGDLVLTVTETNTFGKAKPTWHLMPLSGRECWYGEDHAVLHTMDDTFDWNLLRVHPLARALGHFCDACVAEGPGWLVSLFAHGSPHFPVRVVPGIDTEDLRTMGHLARLRRSRAEEAKTRPFHPIDNPSGYHPTEKRGLHHRAKRSAAVVAQERMLQSGDGQATAAEAEAEAAPVTIDLTTDDNPKTNSEPESDPKRRRTRHSALPPHQDPQPKTVSEALQSLYAFLMSV